ncbi:MAG: amino acid ABC transporter permease [Treponema sp. GWB1_62_6]|nr:MAG: amino acid ABC transporter permease [Treponema sp. GWA1_62_8]OHE64838.1 MAG: amino acid ABC transporter permease [Treponema sp. GWB1_62_6]OHE68348.1 MAG: amino acid ABC transporter permease [Treponema sp. RIFOXYC1_FULL_61_9]OHE69557.1 MAG: amino acid ABC transporter permease [Treponema sp. GWC1_61_84]HCM26934.1 amino acid ABC transporter permease [Treponema sp.]
MDDSTLRPGREAGAPVPAQINVTDGSLIPQRGEKGGLSAWNIAFFGATGILVALPLYKPDPYLKILAFVPDGIVATFGVTIASIACSLVIGLFAGLGRISHVRIINRISTIYVEIIRGIPLLVQLFYIYYALPPVIEKIGLSKYIRLDGPSSAILAMSICYGAYMAEIFRAGIQAIPKGQMEAALALGLSRAQAMRKVILPQTVKIILPPIGNEFIALLKDSSLVSILAVSDLLRRGREYASTSFRYFESYTVIALIYLVMTLFFSRLVAMMEERLRQRGTVH